MLWLPTRRCVRVYHRFVVFRWNFSFSFCLYLLSTFPCSCPPPLLVSLRSHWRVPFSGYVGSSDLIVFRSICDKWTKGNASSVVVKWRYIAHVHAHMCQCPCVYTHALARDVSQPTLSRVVLCAVGVVPWTLYVTALPFMRKII